MTRNESTAQHPVEISAPKTEPEPNTQGRLVLSRKITPSLLVSLGLILAFFTLITALVLAYGVGCGDDGYIASVAKNLAGGEGFSSSMQFGVKSYQLKPFDPMISTGAPVILPTTVMILLFGNTYWVPGLTQVLVCFSLILLIGYQLDPGKRNWKIPLFTLLFLFCCYAFMAYHLEQWYALLGEVPAALFMVLGCVLSNKPKSRKTEFYVGLCFGLASQTKLLALLGFAGFCVYRFFPIIIKLAKTRLRGSWTLTKESLPLLAGFCAPWLAFEVWKLIALGWADYFAIWSDLINMVSRFGSEGSRSTNLLIRAQQRLPIFLDRFGLFLPSIPLILVFARMQIDNQSVRQLFDRLSWSAGVLLVYWLFFSLGLPRYAIMALTLFIFAICLPLLSETSWKRTGVYGLVLLLLTSGCWLRLRYPIQRVETWFGPSANTKHQLETIAFLNRLEIEGKPRFATEWWATASDLEYLLPTSLNFTPYSNPQLNQKASFWLVCNTKFLSKDPEIARILYESDKSLSFGKYYLVLCEKK